jgi:hypothetical protein
LENSDGKKGRKMGWLFGWRSKDELLAHLYEALNYDRSAEGGDKVSVKAKSIVGNTLYAAMERNGKPDGIAVILLSGRGGEWGYKDMDEGMGPNEVNCPLYLLDVAGPPVGTYAAEWRERVKAFHAAKRARAVKAKALSALEVGTKIKLPEGFKPNEFEIVAKPAWSPSKAKGLYGLAADGRVYRIGAAALGKAEEVL